MTILGDERCVMITYMGVFLTNTCPSYLENTYAVCNLGSTCQKVTCVGLFLLLMFIIYPPVKTWLSFTRQSLSITRSKCWCQVVCFYICSWRMSYISHYLDLFDCVHLRAVLYTSLRVPFPMILNVTRLSSFYSTAQSVLSVSNTMGGESHPVKTWKRSYIYTCFMCINVCFL